MYIKDLSVIQRDLKNVIIVDNLPESYINNRENGIPIESWMGSTSDRAFDKLTTILERLNEVEDVRTYIKQIVIRDKVSMYHLLKLIGPPKENSALDGIMDSFRDFKKGAAAFFGLTEKESTTEDSKGNSTEEEDNNTDENTDSNSDYNNRLKLSLPNSSKNYFKKELIDPEPSEDICSEVKVESTNNLPSSYFRRPKINSESGVLSASYR